MSTETILLLGALGATTAINLFSAAMVRAMAERLLTRAIAYRPSGAADADQDLAAGDGARAGRSPLQDVFQQYSKLTGRMADIIFQLTESRHGAREAILATARSIHEEATRASASMHDRLTATERSAADAPPATDDRAPAATAASK